MNRYLWPTYKSNRIYLDLNTIWKFRGDRTTIAYYDEPPFIIVRSMEQGKYWTGAISEMSQEKLDNATWLAERETAIYYVQHKQRWGFSSWYGVFKKLRSREDIEAKYELIDKIEYEFAPDAPFSLDTRPNE